MPRRALLSLTVLGLCLAGVPLIAAVPAANAAANADFTGTWTPDVGVPWTVTAEDSDGSCAGTSAGSGLTFTNCHVSGATYSFDITATGYTSHNTGTISGDSLSGSFDDGSTTSYTAQRTAAGPGVGRHATSLLLICNTPASPSQQGSCTATVGGTGTPAHPYPTGVVTMTATSGTLLGSACTLAAATGAGSAPSCTLGYRPPAGGLPAGTPVPVSATYAGDTAFGASSGGTRLFGYAADADSDDSLGICGTDASGDSTGGCNGYDAALQDALDELQTSLDVAGVCSGTQAARVAAEPARREGLPSCLYDYQAALTAEAANPLVSRTQQRQILNSLANVLVVGGDQHTGKIKGDEYSRWATRDIEQALKSLDQGDLSEAAAQASAAIGDALNAEASAAHGSALGHDLPASGQDSPRASTDLARRGRSARLDVRRVIDFVIAKHPTKADRKAFLAAVGQAYAAKHSKSRIRAREALIVARVLGQAELRRQLKRHGNRLRPVVLARGTQALASGTSATAHLALSPVARRVLKVAALLRKPAFTPVMTITEHRGGHTRTGTVALTVPKVF